MKIPQKIKIGNLTYQVQKLVDSNTTHYGKASMNQQIIWLSDAFESENKKIETFFHEIIHMILDHGKYGQESENEKFVQYLAMSLYQVLKENNLLK